MKTITAEKASKLIGVTTATLATWRCRNRYNLPYIKAGKNVMYDEDAVIAWLRERTRDGTSRGQRQGA